MLLLLAVLQDAFEPLHMEVSLEIQTPVCSTSCSRDDSHHGWVIALNCWGRRLENMENNSELFYVLGRDCPFMTLIAQHLVRMAP